MLPNLKKNRTHKIKSDYGLKDFYKYYKKNGGILNYKDYAKTFRLFNIKIGEYLITHEYTFKLPHKMGALTIRKVKLFVKLSNDKLITNFPINWKATNEYWEKFPDKRKKVFIRYENKHSNGYKYEFSYLKFKATYRGKSLYLAQFNRQLKRKFKDYIFANGELERGLK